MLLLIRSKRLETKALAVRRRKAPITAVKKIGSFAYQFFFALVSFIFALGHAFQSGSAHNILSVLTHNFVAIVEGFLLLSITLAFLFARNREEH